MFRLQKAGVVHKTWKSVVLCCKQNKDHIHARPRGILIIHRFSYNISNSILLISVVFTLPFCLLLKVPYCPLSEACRPVWKIVRQLPKLNGEKYKLLELRRFQLHEGTRNLVSRQLYKSHIIFNCFWRSLHRYKNWSIWR